MVKKVNKNYFKILFEGKAQPHVIKMFSEGCHVCHDLEPDFKKLSKDLTKGYTFVKVDVDEEPEMAKLLAPDGVPTIYFYKDNKLSEITYPKDGYSYDYLKDSILKEINLEDK